MVCKDYESNSCGDIRKKFKDNYPMQVHKVRNKLSLHLHKNKAEFHILTCSTQHINRKVEREAAN